ncbi:MAG TPA: TolC family protein [Fodinibius sp.]|nr:TolC family protein [Fodinibius sp.]
MRSSMKIVIPPSAGKGAKKMRKVDAYLASSPRPLRLLFLMLLILLPSLSLAQQSTSANTQLNRYLQQAAQNNTELKAQFNEYLAALQQVPQVTTLPDPEAAFGYFIQSTETRVGPQQARLSLTQMFPWFGTLDARGDAATQIARAKFAVFQEMRNHLFFKVKKTWYELYHIGQSIGITRENINILETFESLVTSRYETAQASQVDILRVQIEKEDLKVRAAELEDSKGALLQRLAELVNRPEQVQADIPDTLAAQGLPLPMPELKQMTLQQNPRLLKLDFKAASARSSIRVAQKEGLPKFALGGDYIFTGKRDIALANNGKDAIMARVGIQIPLYRKKYRAREKQVQLQLKAVQNRQEATQNQLLTTFEETLRDFYDARRRVSLYKDIQIQRTRQALNILIEEYTTSATDFEELLRLQRKLLEFQLAREEAIVDQNTAVAFMEYLYGKYNTDTEEIENK